MSDAPPPFEGWAVLELMGHRRLGGYVSEASLAGAGFLRIDVPGEAGPISEPGIPPFTVEATQFYSPSSVYCLTPVTEPMARAVAARSRPEPVQRWELPSSRAEEVRPARTCDDCDEAPCVCAEVGIGVYADAYAGVIR